MSLLSVIAGRNRGGAPPPMGASILATFFDDNGDTIALSASPSDHTVNITAPSGTIAIVVFWMQGLAQTSTVTVGGVSATQISTHTQASLNSSVHAILGSFSGSVAVRRVGARSGYAQHAVIFCIGGSTGSLTDWRSTSAFQAASVGSQNVSATPITADGLILSHMGCLRPLTSGTVTIGGFTEDSRNDTVAGSNSNQSVRSVWGSDPNTSTSAKTTTLTSTGNVEKAGSILLIPDA